MKLSAFAHQFTTSLAAIYHKEEADALFLVAIAHYLKLNRAAYLLRKEEEIPESKLEELSSLLTALEKGEPIQYAIGETLFFGLPFKVNSAVLIPRPETEELVDWILTEIKLSTTATNSLIDCALLDIGTGSGCIAISIKKNLDAIQVSGLDISAESLSVARANALLNNVEVNWIEGDILHLPIADPQKKYDVIVSNPPYITLDEKLEMHQNVLAHEPHQALFVSNENPLVFYEAIVDFALRHLTNAGMLFFEINEHLGKETVELIKLKGLNNIVLRKDMQGKDRMILARF